jgi:hypothetical protein
LILWDFCCPDDKNADNALGTAAERTDQLGTGTDLAQRLYGSNSGAFREFNFSTSEPVLNAAGNLRGMVLNAQSRHYFEVIGNNAIGLAFLNIGLNARKFIDCPTLDNGLSLANSLASLILQVSSCHLERLSCLVGLKA